jgi:hypothetical protein
MILIFLVNLTTMFHCLHSYDFLPKYIYIYINLRVRVIVFNATFNNISFISGRRKLPTWQKNALFVWKYQIYVQWIMEKYYTENKRLLWLGHLLCGTNQRQNSSLGWDVNAFLVYRECWPPLFFQVKYNWSIAACNKQ